MSLKESGKEYMIGLGGRKEKGKCNYIIISIFKKRKCPLSKCLEKTMATAKPFKVSQVQ